MNIKIIKKLGLYIFIFLVVILIVNILFNQITKSNCIEGFVDPGIEGNVDRIGKHDVLDPDRNITGYVFFKRNSEGQIEPAKNPRTFNPENINNYVFTKQYVSEDNSNPVVQKKYLMNIFFDYFDDIIWDFNTNKFNLEFFNAIKNNSYYIDPKTNNYFISYLFFVTVLNSVLNLPYPSNIEYYNDVKILASIFTKKLNYACFSMPIFNGDIEDWEEYTNNMVIVIYKYKPTYPSLDHLSSNCCSYSNSEAGQNKCNISTNNSSSSDGNSDARYQMRDLFSQTTAAAAARNNTQLNKSANEHNAPSIASVLNGQKILKSGFVFHLGEIKNIFSFFNTISIDDTGVMRINFIPEVNMTKTDCRGEVNNTAFINSLDNTFEKFEQDFRNSMINNEGNSFKQHSVKLPKSINIDNTSTNLISFILGKPISTNSWTFEVKLNNDITDGAERGSIFQNNSFISGSTEGGLNQSVLGPNTVSISLNIERDDTANWAIGGDYSGFSTTKYYSKSLKDNKPVFSLPMTFMDGFSFDNDKLIFFDWPFENTSHSNIQITDEGQIIYYKNSSTSLVLFDIATFNLTMDDLVTNSCWQCNAKYKNGVFTGGGSILGINGGNNEYVTDSNGKIRFYFDALGSFHGEANISRNSTNITQAYNEKIVEFINKNSVNPAELINNLDKLSNFNFSGTSLQNIGALSLIFLHELYTIESSTDDDVRTIVSGEPTDYLYNFFRNIFNDQWYIFNSDINTRKCNLWFKNSNVYKKEGDFNVSTLLQTPDGVNTKNMYKIETDNDADSVKKCLDKCYDNNDCYAISFNKTSGTNQCELWKKDGIYNNFREAPLFNNKEYEVYNKVCNSNEESIITDAGFQLQDGKFYSHKTLGIQYKERVMASASKYTEGNPFELDRIYVDTNDPRFNKLIKDFVDDNEEYFINKSVDGSNPHTWYYILECNNIENKTETRINYVIQEILKHKSSIKILFSNQTNYNIFYKELDDQIFSNILQPLLSNLNSEQQKDLNSKTVRTQKNSENAKKNAATLNNSAPRISKEQFTNIDNNLDNNIDYSNLEKYKKAGDIMMKKILFNIDDRKNINNTGNVDNLLNIVLFIILILLISFIIIHKSKNNSKC